MSQPISPSEPIVSLHQVSKTFVTWNSPALQLLSLLGKSIGRGATSSGRRTFTAVHPVDLELMPGECLGIIGRNGAGKSTLLQMIAGTLQPSTGRVNVRGRVAALLELGSGFNPDFTGRENVYLNAAILGLTTAEIDARFDSIVAYSGIEDFIDQPVHTYSSGMTLRLAFAVCVHVDADILIIDEALAVGDARFQFKCHATLDQMQREGRTIIFVSHDTNSVKRMCRTAILLERGEILMRGSPNDVTNIYTKLISSPNGASAVREDILALQREPGAEGAVIPPTSAPVIAPSTEAARLIDEERAHQQVSDKEYAYGGQSGRITAVELTDDRALPRLSFLSGSRVRVRFQCVATDIVPDPIYAVTLKSVNGQEIYGTNSYFQNLVTPSVSPGQTVVASFDLMLNVQPGVYFISVGWVRLVNAEVEVIHRRYDVVRFDVLPSDRSFGVAYCPTEITVSAPV